MKKIAKALLAVVLCFTLAGCLADSTQKAVDEYNTELAAYSESISAYNAAATQQNENNKSLQEAISQAQTDVDNSAEALDPQTLEDLRDTLISTKSVLQPDIELLPEYEELTFDENASSDDMKALKEEAKTNLEAMKNTEVPDVPQVVDYSDQQSTLESATTAYENSVKSLEQVTAPSDQFVMERLLKIDSISDIEEVTEDHDPNKGLHKAGSYIGAIYFADSHVDRSEVSTLNGTDSIDVGTEGGGCIEIFANVDDAEKRLTYLSSFDGLPYASGSHEIIGTVLIRISNEMTATDQNELTEKIKDILTAVE